MYNKQKLILKISEKHQGGKIMLEKDIALQLKRLEEIQKRTNEFLKTQTEAINEVLKTIALLREKAEKFEPEEATEEVKAIDSMTYSELKSILSDPETAPETLEKVFAIMQTQPLPAVPNSLKGKLYRVLYENPNVSKKILCDLSVIAGWRIKRDMTTDPKTPLEALINIYSKDAKKCNPYTYEYTRTHAYRILYRNRNLPKEFITAMAEGKIEMNLEWFLENSAVTEEDVMKYVKYLCSKPMGCREEDELFQIIEKRHVSAEMRRLIESTNYERAKSWLLEKKV